MLCEICTAIDLDLVPFPFEGTWSPPILHYDSLAAMKAAANSGCQLCALGADRLRSVLSYRDETPVYRRIKREPVDGEDQSPSAPRRFSVLSLGHNFTGRGGPGAASVGVELYVENDSESARRGDITGRPIRSADNVDFVMQWLRECQTSHMKCRIHPSHARHFVPTRLLFVGSTISPALRIVLGTQCKRSYATLSYCWGKKTPLNRTTRDTLDAKMIDLDIGTLGKTLRDAVTITRNLQLEYLWIDALCIVQDDPHDWAREALTMAEVYTRSTITIAATAASGSEDGCFFPRENNLGAYIPWLLPGRASPEKVYIRSLVDHSIHDLINAAPLNDRAWVMQEKSLSRRTIHYTSNRLFWECQQIFLEEGSSVSSVPNLQVSGFTFASGQVDTTEDLVLSWHSIVEQYTIRKLTFKSDRLPALAGLAQVWARKFKARYVAGCWEGVMPLSLLWTRAQEDYAREHKAIKNPDLPSWTWASFDGAVRYHWNQNIWGVTRTTTCIRNVVVEMDGDQSSPAYSSVKAGLVMLVGRIKLTSFDGQRVGFKSNPYMPWDMTLTPTYEQGIYSKGASFDYEPRLNTPVPLLQVYAWETNGMYNEFVMLLEPEQELGYYKRIGLGLISWNKRYYIKGVLFTSLNHRSWFDDAPEVPIVIR